MRPVYLTRNRPERTAKTARRIWDWITRHDGAEPKDLSLMMCEGAFREWRFTRASGEVDMLEAGLIGNGRFAKVDYSFLDN